MVTFSMVEVSKYHILDKEGVGGFTMVGVQSSKYLGLVNLFKHLSSQTQDLLLPNTY